MFDINKRTEFFSPTVSEVIEALQELPADMTMCFCGTSVGYLHVDTDKEVQESIIGLFKGAGFKFVDKEE